MKDLAMEEPCRTQGRVKRSLCEVLVQQSNENSHSDDLSVCGRGILKIGCPIESGNFVIPKTCIMQWRSFLRHCAINQKVADSSPFAVIGIFHWRNSSGRTMALGSTQPLTEGSTRNISWWIKAACAWGWQLYHLRVPIVLKCGSPNLLEPSGPVQDFLYLLCLIAFEWKIYSVTKHKHFCLYLLRYFGLCATNTLKLVTYRHFYKLALD